MIRARFLICEIKRDGSRLPSKMQCRAKSIVAYPIEHNETKVDNEMQYARPTKDIPGPKALPLLGNWFRFLPYIGKSSLVKACSKHTSTFLLYYSSLDLNALCKPDRISIYGMYSYDCN